MNLLKGFTLIELLVVIAIIGILSSVAVVNLNSSKQVAGKAAAMDQLRQLQPLILLCFEDGKELTFDEDMYNQIFEENNGVEPENYNLPICQDSEINWPLFFDEGWHYEQVTSDAQDSFWVIELINFQGNNSFYCAHAGCN